MTHSHPPIAVGRPSRWILTLALLAVAVVAVSSVVALWPDGRTVHRIAERAQLAAPGVTFPGGTVTSIDRTCPASGSGAAQQSHCGQIGVRLAKSSGASEVVSVAIPPEVSSSGLRAGDSVQLMRTPAGHGAKASYSYWATERAPALGWMLGAFALLIVLVARRRGLMAIVGVGISGVVLAKFMLPALLAGSDGPAVALAGTAVIMYVVLYTTHGFSTRTSVALAGTLLGAGLIALIGWYMLDGARLTGVSDESAGVLQGMSGSIDLRGLLLCGVIVAGLGVLNDVTITQTSAVWELRAAAPHLPRRSIFAGAMRIGCDHIASTIYTIVFAYAGSAIVVLLIVSAYQQPLLQLLSAEDIAEEVVRTLASGFGVVLAMPLTTALAAVVAHPHRESGPVDGLTADRQTLSLLDPEAALVPAAAVLDPVPAPAPAPVRTSAPNAVPAASVPADTSDAYREFWGKR